MRKRKRIALIGKSVFQMDYNQEENILTAVVERTNYTLATKVEGEKILEGLTNPYPYCGLRVLGEMVETRSFMTRNDAGSHILVILDECNFYSILDAMGIEHNFVTVCLSNGKDITELIYQDLKCAKYIRNDVEYLFMSRSNFGSLLSSCVGEITPYTYIINGVEMTFDSIKRYDDVENYRIVVMDDATFKKINNYSTSRDKVWLKNRVLTLK